MQACAVQLRSTLGSTVNEACMINLKLTSFMLCTDKKQKRKKGRVASGGNAVEALAIVLFEDETEQLPVNPDLPNLDAWRPGRVLQIGDARFSIVYNPPTAEKVQPKPHLRCCSVMLPPLSDPVGFQASEVFLTASCCAQIQIFGGTIVGCPVVAAAVVRPCCSPMLCSQVRQSNQSVSHNLCVTGCGCPFVCADAAIACILAGELCTTGGLQVAVVQREPVSGKQVHIMPLAGACTCRSSALPADHVRSAACTRTLIGIWHVR